MGLERTQFMAGSSRHWAVSLRTGTGRADGPYFISMKVISVPLKLGVGFR